MNIDIPWPLAQNHVPTEGYRCRQMTRLVLSDAVSTSILMVCLGRRLISSRQSPDYVRLTRFQIRFITLFSAGVWSRPAKTRSMLSLAL